MWAVRVFRLTGRWSIGRSAILYLLERLRIDSEIKLIMPGASRVEIRFAQRTMMVAVQVIFYTHFQTADSTQNGFLMPLVPRPYCGRMLLELGMAILAGIVKPAAFHLDRNHIHWLAVMNAAGLRINRYTVNAWPF
jgi:hypothetical protein